MTALQQQSQRQTVSVDLKTHENDTGSSQVQVAHLTERIESLTEHLKAHPQDNHSRRGLLQMVGKRRRLLDYLKRTEPATYQDVVQRLKLRR